MQLPQEFINAIANAKGFNQQAFEQVHASGEQVTSIRSNPFKKSAHPLFQAPIPWTRFGYYLSERPSFTFDPLFHAGCYYVQEASSMFLEQAISQTTDLSKPLKVLDLCASPGGKSTHLHSLLSPDSLLVSNEVIRQRAAVLKDNIIKWGCENAVVTNNDPKDFSKLENYFDVIVIDAPCSGSGLFRRDADAIQEWSENNVNLCSQRQQRIIADIWPALKQDGVLIYSTCSYSQQEDEDIIDWMLSSYSCSVCDLITEEEWGIVTTNGGYRFWPDKVKGEGFFLSCVRKEEGGDTGKLQIKRTPEQVTKNEELFLNDWVKKNTKHFIKHQSTVYGWPENSFQDFAFLLQELKVLYSGIIAGELMRNKLVPDHALAMSSLVSETVNKWEVDYDTAIKFLQKKEFEIGIGEKGWGLITFENQSLGWVNILPNRINNYYPKELRILKDR